jgi:hypothetical protein
MVINVFPKKYFSYSSYFYWPTDYWLDLPLNFLIEEVFEFGTVYDKFELNSKPMFICKERQGIFSLERK